MNKLRRLAISIIEELEDHGSKHTKPFDEENWYFIEDEVYTQLLNYLVGDEE